MNTVFTYSFYGLAALLLLFSFLKDKRKTLLSLKKAWKMFTGVLPQFVAILLFVGVALAVLSPETIRRMIGEETGFIGMLLASLVGAFSLVPVMIAFPIVSELLKNGAGIIQMAVFVSTLTTVGLITIPIETKYLGKKIAVLRNMLAFVFSFITAYLMGVLLK
ncbi:permease [Enterocloster clostridioformis]|uniref:permease n=1 Tax=Enterocloster clostridioformis TaxID=1531 RepID=UPI00080C855D|nr:permease [Enterocloster clostridioformis]ANU49819.1 permease [Lachnoclostridium sp. YL32]NDO28696.1 permease [Enterocloster clostridioformis]OXE71122.1 permease [Enterocloster clostridioformis]QQR01274.1 permease [Enterocloster clostridioformis]